MAGPGHQPPASLSRQARPGFDCRGRIAPPCAHYRGPTRTGGRSDRLSTEHKAISATFTAFCEQLLAAYPTAPVVAVICNVIIHRSKIVQRWLRKDPRLQVLHGARYSPHDNPVERIWGALKAWLANNPPLTIQGRVRQVHAFFRERTRSRC